MTVPAFFRVRWHWSGTKSGAGLGSRSVPPRLRRCSCGRGLLVLGPARTPERQRVGPARCRGNRQAPVPGTARAPLPPPLRGVRSLCVVFIQTQIRLNYGRELDARASEGSVGKCLRERSDHDHWISPHNGEQNWHTVRSLSCMDGRKTQQNRWFAPCEQRAIEWQARLSHSPSQAVFQAETDWSYRSPQVASHRNNVGHGTSRLRTSQAGVGTPYMDSQA